MRHTFKNHIERIQNSSEDTKKFWLYFYSSATMLMVIMLWGGYMNLSVPGVPGPINADTVGNATHQSAAQYAATSQDQKAPSPTTIFVAGLEQVINGAGIRLSRGVAAIKDILMPNSSTIIIKKVEKSAPQVIMNGLEDLPNGELPVSQ